MHALPVHRSRERTPHARGRAFGVAQRDRVRHTVAVYRRLLAEASGVGEAEMAAAGAHVGDLLARRWPDLLEELSGMADGARVPVEALLAVNARTELLGAACAGECSVIASTSGGTPLLAQNWDWHPALARASVVWSVELPDGGWLCTLTEAGMLAKIGLSGQGLACGLNFLRTSLDGGVDGVPIHVLLRLVLDRCADVRAARDLLLGAPVSASSCITVVGAGGDGTRAMAAVELCPAGARTVDGEDQPMVHTNHFLAGPPAGTDLERADGAGTAQRRDQVLALMRGGSPVEGALASHAPAVEPVCRHVDRSLPWPERRATLASVVMEPAGRSPRMRVAAGPPCSVPFAEVGR